MAPTWRCCDKTTGRRQTDDANFRLRSKLEAIWTITDYNLQLIEFSSFNEIKLQYDDEHLSTLTLTDYYLTNNNN